MLKNNDISIPEAGYADLCKVGFFERKQVKLTIIWNEKISRNKQILTLKKLYPELNKVSTVEIYKITKKRRNGNLQRWDGDLLLTFRIKQKKCVYSHGACASDLRQSPVVPEWDKNMHVCNVSAYMYRVFHPASELSA